MPTPTRSLFAAGFLVFSAGAFSQQPPAVGQFQQIPPAPESQRPAPVIKLEQGTVPAAPGADQRRILVNTLRITGNAMYSEAELVEVAGFRPGGELTLGELRGMAARIANYYRGKGFFVAQAYLPPQEIRDGSVAIEVSEGRYGKVVLRNQSKLVDSLPNDLLGGLNSGDPITAAPLESRLLLLSDIPGVNVSSTLVPGAAAGTSDLLVDVTPGRSVSGSVEADNAGNRYTGEYRVGGTVHFNNLTGHGDVLGFRALTSGSGLKYGRAFYQTQLGRATVGVALSALEYRLGEEFSSLNAHGKAAVATLYGSYPLIRSRSSNLYLTGALRAKTFRDEVDATSSVTDKRAQVATIGLHGNHRDTLFRGLPGLTTYGVDWSAGNIDIRTPAALAIDAATARSDGHFGKLGFRASRSQALTDTLSLYGAIDGQFASKNLDISEKMGLGGMFGVRAYPQGEAFGDEGYIATLEARLLLRGLSERVPGQVHLVGFVDTGTVTINKDPWLPGDNSRTLSAIGVGLTWAEYENFSVQTYYARKLGNADAISAPDKSGRFWIRLIKYF